MGARRDRVRVLAHLAPALDLILADYNLPQFNGLRALHLLRERGWIFLLFSSRVRWRRTGSHRAPSLAPLTIYSKDGSPASGRQF